MGLFAVAVVRFVVQDRDVFEAHQIRHDALDHLTFGFQRLQALAAAALEQRAGSLGDVHSFARFECVVVGDDDLGGLDIAEHIGGDKLAGFVIAVGVVGLEDAEAVFDGEARGDDEESFREAFAVGVADGVDGLPGNEHRHDGGLASAGGELECEAHQVRIGFVIGVGQVIKEAFAGFILGCDFSKPDGRFGGFQLAEERADAGEGVGAPVLEQAGGFRGDLPLIGLQVAPDGKLDAEFGDDGGGVIALIFGGDVILIAEG